ncbi:MAG: hypothetical protein IJ326_07515 [Lachnospiraceae bacterium]|nr:hypothetical protein [Lachnospiraceae bacterium]
MNWLKMPTVMSNASCTCMGAKCQGRDAAIRKVGCGVHAGYTAGFCLINFF